MTIVQAAIRHRLPTFHLPSDSSRRRTSSGWHERRRRVGDNDRRRDGRGTPLYDIHHLGKMMADRLRTEPYFEALRRAVRPGSIVVDIGTGTGVHALLACKLGARRVYAIEPSDAVEVARAIAEANGFGDRMECIQALSTDVTLPERADVVVSDLRGAVPLFDGHISSIVDARQRLLAPGGTLIPTRDVLCLAVAEAPDVHDAIVSTWDHNPLALDMRAAKDLALNQVHWAAVAREQLLTTPEQWAILDYTSIEDKNIRGNVVLAVQRSGRGHGLAHWFEATLLDEVEFSVGPGEPDNVYGRPFLPWPRPVALTIGDEIHVELRADRNGGDYVWTWRTRIVDCQGHASTKAEFEQSTFFSTPLSRRQLRLFREDHAPELNGGGRVDHLILGSMDRRVPLGKIAEDVHHRFPARYPSRSQALARVRELAGKYADERQDQARPSSASHPHRSRPHPA